MAKLPIINLQEKTEALEGYAEKYWFENDFIKLEKTLFHKIEIPLKPFDSGLKYEEEPLKTTILIEWLNLNLKNPDNLDNLFINERRYPKAEASIYVGSAHNMCRIISMKTKRIKDDTYRIEGELNIYFADEGVAENEYFFFESLIHYKG